MEATTFNIWGYILIPLLSAVLGGWVGAYFGSKYQSARENKKMKKVRDIAIKALDILKKYNKHSFTEAESEFNTSLTIAEKRTIIVLLHKLGIPINIPINNTFDIHRIHFSEILVDKDEIDGMILQINQKHCDNLFFIDAETYFNSNQQLVTLRNVGKKYVKDVLSKSRYNSQTGQVSYPDNWVSLFGVGEYLSLRVLHEQACIDILYDNDGKTNPEKITEMLHEIDMGIWDTYLFSNYEVYKNTKVQIQMTNTIQSMAMAQQV